MAKEGEASPFFALGGLVTGISGVTAVMYGAPFDDVWHVTAFLSGLWTSGASLAVFIAGLYAIWRDATDRAARKRLQAIPFAEPVGR